MKRRISYVILMLGILSIFVVQAASGQAQGPIYIVQEGDTLFGIAWKFGTTVEELAEANDIADPFVLYPGMELVIPGFEGVSGVLTIKEIGIGETLDTLSWRHGIKPEDIVRLNRLVNPDRLFIGQGLILPEVETNPNIESSKHLQVFKGDKGILSTATLYGVNPWMLDPFQDEARLWIVSGELVELPADETDSAIPFPSPIKAIEIDPEEVIQGRMLEIRMQLAEPYWAEGQLGERCLTFHEMGPDTMVALQGIDAMAELGLEDLEIWLYDSQDGDSIFGFKQSVKILDGGYGYDPVLIVPPETMDPDTIESENEKVHSITSVVTPERMWEGVFQFPTSYYEKFPSVFGTRRNYNNLGYHTYHNGLDLYGSTKTEVMAPARGRVVFADTLTIHGMMTYIDHGWGIFTGYGHQSQIFVSPGDIVEPGQVIGMVGGTGRVTGAHLHWEVWAGGVPVNAIEWTERVFP
jgi:murein DD-endopeptidase MepM/ murein hydrolase activator NlpD